MSPDRDPRASLASHPLLACSCSFFDALDRHDPLALVQPEHDDALRRPALHADPAHPDTNGLALIADEHQIVGFLDGKYRDDGAVLPPHAHRDDTGPAASRDPI